MSLIAQVNRIKENAAIIRNKFVSLGLAKSTDNLDALATAANGITPVGIGKPIITTTAYDEDNEIAITATTNQGAGFIRDATIQTSTETYATLTVDGNKVTMLCAGAKIERTVGASIDTCTVNVTFSKNAGATLISATTFENGTISVVNQPVQNNNSGRSFSIQNVVCGSALSINTEYMTSFYGSFNKHYHQTLQGGTITVPTAPGTYTVEVGELDD